MSELCKDCACENVCGITHLPEDKACVYYKAEAVTELEKVKTEISGSCIFSISKIDVLDIIDKHISELKGEKQEENHYKLENNITKEEAFKIIRNACDKAIEELKGEQE